MPMSVPGFDHSRNASGDVNLAESVGVIRGAVDLGQPSALIEVGGQLAQLG
jgi:hypothetical protein